MYHMDLTTAMLADSAAAMGGKLFILGGQWDRIASPAFPTTHPSMAVVLVLRVEYTEALDTHELEVALMLDGEHQGVGAKGQLATGHSPTSTRGAPTYVPMVLPFYQIVFKCPGRYEWVVRVDGKPLGLPIPMEVITAPQISVTLPGGAQPT